MTETPTTEMAGTILPSKEVAKSRPDNDNMLIASGRALAIHTTLIMRLGVGDQKKRNTRLCLSITIHHIAINEYVPNSEFHGSGMHLSNGIFLPNIFFGSS